MPWAEKSQDPEHNLPHLLLVKASYKATLDLRRKRNGPHLFTELWYVHERKEKLMVVIFGDHLLHHPSLLDSERHSGTSRFRVFKVVPI